MTSATLRTSAGPRVDAHPKVTGRALYTEDLPSPHGMVYGRVLLSPYSHARIRTLRSEKAERLPGVVAVLTREHLAGGGPLLRPGEFVGSAAADRPLIATGKVRFDGEPVAAVAAETLAIADRALELVEVEYEELPAVFDVREAVAPGAPLVHEERGSNFVGEFRFGWGDVEDGLRRSDHVSEHTLVFPHVFHYPMENVGTSLAQFVGDEALLWAPIQHLFEAVREIGELFHLEPNKVRIRTPYIGGGFGAKELKPSMVIALWLARQMGRPVKMVPSAEESFRNDSRHPVVYRARTGVRRDGAIEAWDIELLVNNGAYGPTPLCARLAAMASWGPYRVPHLRVAARAVYTNTVPAGAFRGVGKAQATWGCETHVDMTARELGMDPVEFRLKNLLHRGDLVVEGTTPLDADLQDLTRRAVKAMGWDGHSRRVGAIATALPAESPLVRGRGLAVSLRHGHLGTGRSYATAKMDRTGRVRVLHNATEIGEGVYTVIRRVAAETLELPEHQIEVSDPDTSANPYYDGVSSQRSTVCLGLAVQRACEDLKRELLDVAAQAKGSRPEEWRLAQGRLWHGEQDFSLEEVIRGLGPQVTVLGKGSYSTPRATNPFGGVVPHWSVSVGAAEVEVDKETGESRLLRYVTVGDIGKAINPVSCHAQLDGGAVMGLGDTLFEEVVYGQGHMENGDAFQYRVPLMHDLPEAFFSEFAENGDGPGPMGSKGMAQVSIVVVAPAVGNALYEACGARVTDLPITAEKVLRALGTL
ncbi:MAG: xanthine dehydrogenase family protein molybdopterin-binding subunit [Chloroflexi bacterium]|nr:xanthine dehydrogenase family protein molybdopterin-binding subunit [Chloroflexota bacterium]